MTVRFTFVGFRHPHIFDMYQRCQSHADVDVVAGCEEHAATRAQLVSSGDVEITHSDTARVLEEVACDVVAVGDAYGRRAEVILAALRSGRHVISDKPPCITLQELDEIEQVAHDRQLTVGCMLDMRDLAVYLGIRETIQAGKIGAVHAISFDGQHPMLYGQRPEWYYEPGMHGGVLNDIAIHAIDFIPWATGHAIKTVVAARGWNATLPQHPDFQQCGQAMLVLENGAGVICDVSYLTPDSFAYEMPLYWRFTFWGSEGTLEAAVNSPHLTLYRNGDQAPCEIALPPKLPGAYLNSFLAEIAGESHDLHVSSSDAFRAARISLKIQQAADEGLCHVEV